MHGLSAAVVVVVFGLVSIYAIHYFSQWAGLDPGPLAEGTWPGWLTVVVSCGLVVVALQGYCFDRVSWLPILVVGVGLAVVLANVFLAFMAFTPYGDAGYLPMMVEREEPFSRWLLGTAVLAWGYPVVSALPGVDPEAWVKLTGALVMALSTAAVVARSRGRLAYLLPAVTPMWMLFSSGYDEYYPFLAGVYVFFVFALTTTRLPKSYGIPLLAAVMPLLYIAFAPLGALLLVRYWIDHPSLWLRSLFLAAIVYLAGLFVLWPGGPIDYATALYFDLNLGEVNTAYAPYQGESASEYSPFFGLSYALSRQHGLELLYMLSAGVGVVIPVLLVGSSVMLAVKLKPSIGAFKRDLPRLFFVAMVLWQLYYFVFMIPKLGPFVDIDLFFTFYFVLAILTGAMCDKCLSLLSEPRARVMRYYLLSACVGAGLGASYLLLAVGVLPET